MAKREKVEKMKLTGTPFYFCVVMSFIRAAYRSMAVLQVTTSLKKVSLPLQRLLTDTSPINGKI